MRAAGIDPGGKHTSVVILDSAPRAGAEGYPHHVALVAVRTWIHASTSRDDVQRDAAEIVEWLVGHGVDLYVMERVEHVFISGGKGGAAASGIATGIKDAEHVRAVLETRLTATDVAPGDVRSETARARARMYSTRARDVYREEKRARDDARAEDPPRHLLIGKWREPALEDLVDGWIAHEAGKFRREVSGIEHERDAAIAGLCAFLPAAPPKPVKERKVRARKPCAGDAERATATREERAQERERLGCVCGPAGRHRRGCKLAGARKDPRSETTRAKGARRRGPDPLDIMLGLATVSEEEGASDAA